MIATVQPDNRTYTIWGNGGKYEWIIRDGEQITARSNPIFNSYGAAKRAMVKALSQADAFND
jgi:hypothetical protein